MRMKGGGLLVRHVYVVLALACLFHSGWVSAAAVPHDIAGVVAAVVNASNLTVHTGEARARIGVVQVSDDSLCVMDVCVTLAVQVGCGDGAVVEAIAGLGFRGHGVASPVGAVELPLHRLNPGTDITDTSTSAHPRSRATFSVRAFDAQAVDQHGTTPPAHVVLCFGVGQHAQGEQASSQLVGMLTAHAATRVVLFSSGTPGEGIALRGVADANERSLEFWDSLYVLLCGLFVVVRSITLRAGLMRRVFVSVGR